MALRALCLAVVGADYPNKRDPTRRFEIALCRPGEPVDLVPEPKNPADPRAIAVFSCRGVQLGYLSAERCGLIGNQLSKGAGVRAIFQSQASYGAVIRAALDGEAPDLPAAEPAQSVLQAEDDQDFWPDEEWPDF